MQSKPMDIPENSGHRWEMVLTNPITNIKSFTGDVIDTKPPFLTKATFERTNQHFVLDDGTTCAEYKLVDIVKM